MNLSQTLIDNITEVLLKIIEFTKTRDEIITQNILNVKADGFVPKDVDVPGFADVMAQAISEYIRNERLLLCDSENIKFGANGDFDILPIVDEHAKDLFENDIKAYLTLQIKRLSENTLNQKVAGELLRQRHHQSVEMIN